MSYHIDMDTIFSDFEVPQPTQWWEDVKKSLGTEDSVSSLITHTPEDIDIQPIYTQKQAQQDATIPSNLSQALIFQPVYADNAIAANQTLLDALSQGANSAWITGSTLPDIDDWQQLMQRVSLDTFAPAFDMGESNPSLLFQLINHYQQVGIDENKRAGSVWFSPLSTALATGHIDYPRLSSESFYRSIFDETQTHLSGYRIIHALPFRLREAGGNAVQEIALGLSELAAYLDWFTDWGYTPQSIVSRMQLVFGIGSDYFMEIAKIRAGRVLLSRLVQAWDDAAGNIPVFSLSLLRNKSMFDLHTNILRSANEALSAMIGGCDALCIRPYNETQKIPDDHALRLSRNIPLLLRHEAYADFVTDPAAGSFYLNELTEQLIEKSWKLFLDIESVGGYEQAMTTGKIQSIINANDKKEKEAFQKGQKIVVGTNKYPIKDEIIDPNTTPISTNIFVHSSTDFEPLKPERLSQKLDELRVQKQISHNEKNA